MKHWKFILVSLLAAHLLLLITTQFTAWPEMLFWPYLVLRGWLPYQDIGIVHSPLLVVELTFFYKIFGLGIFQQKIFSWLLALFIDLLLFKIAHKLYGLKPAILALLCFILLHVYYDGNGVWFDQALALFPLLIFFAVEKKKYFLAGLLWALAVFTKQTAVWFLIPVFFAFYQSQQRAKFILDFSKAALLVFLTVLLGLAIYGLQTAFINWAVIFGIGILPRQIGQIKAPGLKEIISSLLPYLVFLPLIIQKNKRYLSGLIIWSLAAAMGVFPRWELFHLQPALPFLSLAISTLLGSLWKSRKSFAILPGVIIIIAILILISRGIQRKIDKPDRFNDANDQKIVQTVRRITVPNQLIFVTNYWDNLYPLTQTLPATRPFIPQLAWYINQPTVEANLLNNLKSTPAKIVVRGQFKDTDSLVNRFPLINDYIDAHYNVIETISGIDILQIK